MDIEPDEATDELLRALGGLVWNFGVLQTLLALFIGAYLAGGQPVDQRIGEAVTVHMSFQNLVNAWASLYRLLVTDPDLVSRMEALVKRLFQAEEKRNQFIHSLYLAGGGFVRRKATARARGGLRVDMPEVTAEEILVVVREMKAIENDLMTVFLHTGIRVKHVGS